MKEETIVKAIVIKSINYKENDKIITLLSAELGKISAILRGANKKDAKLKFAGQIFCFAEFSLIEQGEMFLVKTASEIESFFDITLDYDKLKIGSCVLEIAEKTTRQHEYTPSVFLNTLKAIEAIVLKNINAKLVLIKFMLEVFKHSGYQIVFDKCKNCGAKFNSNTFLNIETGAFLCSLCKTEECIDVSNAAFNVLKLISNSDYTKLTSISIHDHHLNEVLVILNANFTGKFQIILKSLKNL